VKIFCYFIDLNTLQTLTDSLPLGFYYTFAKIIGVSYTQIAAEGC
jgi:hypothetical protein